jgi:hypothetical protein
MTMPLLATIRVVRASIALSRKEVATRARWLRGIVVVLILAPFALGSGPAQAEEPITYVIRFTAPDKHVAEVEARYPTDGRASIELMMPVWTPVCAHGLRWPGVCLRAMSAE